MDPYGFPKFYSQETEDNMKEKLEKYEQDCEKRWDDYINSIGGYGFFDIHDPRVKELVRGGISRKHRPMVWSASCDVIKRVDENPDLYYSLLQKESKIPHKIITTIDVDVPRTFPGSTVFTREELRNVLVAFAVHNPGIGYCQSLSFIAAILISVVGELPAFYMLDTIVTSLLPKEYYTPGMQDFQTDLKVIELLCEERTPVLYSHTISINFQWILVIGGWLLSMYANTLPIPTVFRIYDAFLFEGQKVLFRVAIAIMRQNEAELLQYNDCTSFADRFNAILKNELDADTLMELAFSIRAFSRKHLDEKREDAVAIRSKQREKQSVSIMDTLLGKLGI